MSKGIAAAIVATAVAIGTFALALPVPATAQDHVTAPEMSASQPQVTGHPVKRHGWLTTTGPDARGRYVASIDVTDLDANSAAGHAKLASRVEWAAVTLCDMTAPDELVAGGYYDPGERKCRDDLRASALTQLSAGQRVSTMTFGLHTKAR